MNTNQKAKRVLCYGDSNTWGWIPMGMGKKRFSVNERWPGYLQNLLGNKYEVIEEGLGGRTCNTEDNRPEYPERNGNRSIPMVLETHLPLDLVIVMLGTTECKESMNLSSTEITNGLKKLIQSIQNFKVLKTTNKPKILILAPIIIDEETDFASMAFKNGRAKSIKIVEKYKILANELGTDFLDINEFIKVDSVDGIHFGKTEHGILAKAIYDYLG